MCLFMLTLSQQASAWWQEQWPYRLPITLDTSITGAAIENSQAEIPLLVRLHGGSFQDFLLLKEDLSDIRFVAGDGKTPLRHKVEHVDYLNQMAFVWVKVPQLTAGVATERVWMYYGNTSAQAPVDMADTYETDQALVLGFSPAEAVIGDATAYGTAVETQGVTRNSAGLIAASGVFDGTAFLRIADVPQVRAVADKGMTLSAWIKPANPDGVILSRVAGNSQLALALAGGQLYADLNNGTDTFTTPRTSALATDSWHHVALRLAGDTMELFVNGDSIASVPVQWTELSGDLVVGAMADGQRGFSGEMDEVRVERIARSADWIKVAAVNQGFDDRLLTLQAAEQLGSGGSGTIFRVIFESIDEAGWTVILLLAVMAAVSWMVMIGKMFYIRIVRRDNELFLAQYRKLAGNDPAMLDAEESEDDTALANSPIAQALLGRHDHYQSSPIYHLYHRVLKEVRGRIGKTVGANATGLSASAVASIRAATDAEMIREMQKMNGQMVFLTIAISGGPFLGLLGTVLGVMITFGNIAATGDVNIAAIAPGVSAALATTVAGLIVAIPALFGYNYIFSRIKETMVDMRTFADEFVTRVAEYYGQE